MDTLLVLPLTWLTVVAVYFVVFKSLGLKSSLKGITPLLDDMLLLLLTQSGIKYLELVLSDSCLLYCSGLQTLIACTFDLSDHQLGLDSIPLLVGTTRINSQLGLKRG